MSHLIYFVYMIVSLFVFDLISFYIFNAYISCTTYINFWLLCSCSLCILSLKHSHMELFVFLEMFQLSGVWSRCKSFLP